MKIFYQYNIIYFRLKEHMQINNDQRIRQLLIENLMKSGSNEEMLQQVRNYPYELIVNYYYFININKFLL